MVGIGVDVEGFVLFKPCTQFSIMGVADLSNLTVFTQRSDATKTTLMASTLNSFNTEQLTVKESTVEKLIKISYMKGQPAMIDQLGDWYYSLLGF